jgi:transcriptional regulator with XRE-family HTH domain
MTLEALVKKHGITQEELGQVIGVSASAVSHKLAGRRPWFQDEVNKILPFLTGRLGRPVTYEEIFEGNAA